jgi:hypothetical protein
MEITISLKKGAKETKLTARDFGSSAKEFQDALLHIYNVAKDSFLTEDFFKSSEIPWNNRKPINN